MKKTVVQFDHDCAKKWLVDDLFPVMLDCQQQISNLEFLEANGVQNRPEAWTRSFFDQLRHQYYFILITQMAKVLDTGEYQRISLLTLTARLGSRQTVPVTFDQFFEKHAKQRFGMFRLPPASPVWISFRELQADMKSLRDRFKEHRETIVSIVDQRNTMMAHTDPDRQDFRYIPIPNLRSVLEVALEVWSIIANNLHPRLMLAFPHSSCWQLQNLVIDLESLERHQDFVRQQLLRPAIRTTLADL